MKNLLEEEFIIENCTLAQRLAIKAYCDEKKIEYFEKSLEKIERDFLDLGYYKTTDGLICFISCKNTNYKKVSFLEVIQALEEYQKFKAGDVVKIINGGNGSSYLDGAIITIINRPVKKPINYGGQIYEWIDTISYYGETFDKSHTIGLSHHCVLQELTPKEVTKWRKENPIKLPKINGYEGKVEGDYIVYGSNCAKFHKNWFIDYYINFIKHPVYGDQNRTIKAIKLNTDVEISIEQIEEIVKYIEHKEKQDSV